MVFNSQRNQGVAGFSLESIGERGKMLYGLDSDGEPWLALRAGTEVDDQVQLPAQTQEIYKYAMGGYEIAFRKLYAESG